MSASHDISGSHHTDAVDACYWAELDVSVLPRRHRMDPKRLGFLFENEVPCAIDTLHAVYRSASQDRAIGCAIARDRLEAILGDRSSALLTLSPAGIPKFIGEDSLESHSFNLLTGEYEPNPVRQRRRHWVLSMVTLAAVVGALFTVGLERRRMAVDRATQAVRADAANLIADSIGPSAGSSLLPPEQRIVSTLRRLEQTREVDHSPEGESESVELVQVFFDLLEAWPKALHAQTELISITSESISVRGRLQSTADVQSLADSLGQMNGWAIRQPQISTARDGVQAMLTLSPLGGEENSQ